MGGRVLSTHLGFRERGFSEERRTAAGEDEVLKLRDAGLEGGGHGVQRRGRGAPVAGVHGRGGGAVGGEERFWGGFGRERKAHPDAAGRWKLEIGVNGVFCYAHMPILQV